MRVKDSTVPNDAVYHSNGDLYFTDPPYGLVKNMEDSAKEIRFQGIYRLKKSGNVELLQKNSAGRMVLLFRRMKRNFMWAIPTGIKSGWSTM